MHLAQRSQTRSLTILICIGIAAMFCTRLSNRIAGELLGVHWLASSFFPAAVVAVAVYLSTRPVRPFAFSDPSTHWRRVFQISGVWLAAWLTGSALYSATQGSWVAYVTGAPALIGFLLLGPITEELIFRGSIFELAERAWPQVAVAPILVSTALFSAYHLQLHDYQITPFVLLQLAFTLPLGYVLGTVRGLTGSIWPGLAVHIATNLPHAVGHSNAA